MQRLRTSKVRDGVVHQPTPNFGLEKGRD